MANFGCLRPLRLCAVMAVLLAPALAGAGPDVDPKELRVGLKAVDARVSEAPLQAADVRGIRAELGLAGERSAQKTAPTTLSGAGGLFSMASVQPQSAAPRGQGRAPVDVSTTNFRLMLATLAQSHTGVNNLSVITAQGDRGPTAVSIRSGTVSLADVQAFSARAGFAPMIDGTLVAPVVLWPEATLVLRPGERLSLARDAGAFLLSMGRIEIEGAVIEAVGPENPHEESFAPFITVLGGGSLIMERATVRGLGFGRTNKFAGVTVAGNPLMQAEQEVVIRDTLFDDVKVVSISGAADAQITGNTFQNARSNALNISGALRTQVRENLFRGLSPTNAIRVELGSDHTRIAENIFLAGDRVAILINGASNHVEVEDNVIWQRNGAGIKFLNTRCGRATGNMLIDNQQKGIEVRKSDGIVVEDNLFAGNRSAGIWVSAQAEGAQTKVRDNTFVGNGAGLSAATGAEIWVAQNNFKRQLPKLLDGDIAQLATAVVRNLEGSGPMLFSRGQAFKQDALLPLCGGDT